MGSVYVSKTLVDDSMVAIKEIDISRQKQKWLLVNEILVMKESIHPNVINFLDAYLVRPTELWVIMEYMGGGALTDVIENNTLSEQQIAAISFEVGLQCSSLVHKSSQLSFRRARGWPIYIASSSSIATSNRTTCSWISMDV